MEWGPRDLQPMLGRPRVWAGVPWRLAPPSARSLGLRRLDMVGGASGVVPSRFADDAPGTGGLRLLDDETIEPFGVSADLLTDLFPALPRAQASTFVDPVNLYLARYRIDSIARIACFLGQVGLESGGLRILEERLKYSASERLLDVFGSAAFGDDDAGDFVGKAEALANRVYARKNGNGDVDSGDGWKYRGRGLIQLTGRANYAAFAARNGVDVVASPDLLLQPTYAVMSACDYWKTNDLSPLADAGDIDTLTYRVNRKKLHLAERVAITKSAASALRTLALGVRE